MQANVRDNADKEAHSIHARNRRRRTTKQNANFKAEQAFNVGIDEEEKKDDLMEADNFEEPEELDNDEANEESQNQDEQLE